MSKPQTIEDIKRELANKWLFLLLHSNPNVPYARVTSESIISDGRKRKTMFAGLVKDGYVAIVGDGDAAEFRVTSKAWDEVPAEAFDLTTFYKYDAFNADKGECDYVAFDRLNLGQKKTVVVALQTDPTTFTMMFVNERAGSKKNRAVFLLGESSEAREKTGGWHDAKHVITNAAWTAKHAEAMRADYKAKCQQAGLNWFLQRTKAIEKEETVPVCEKQPFFGGHPSIDREPANWRTSLPAVIERTKDDIKAARLRLETLQKMEAAVEAAGGWDAFLTQYDAAIEGYVADNFGKDE